MGKFFDDVHDKLKRDYTLIIDRSLSMSFKMDEDAWHNGEKWVFPYADEDKSRWYHTKQAVKLIAPAIVECDKTGVTLMFFSDEDTAPFQVHEHIKDSDKIEDLFHKIKPKGGTDLHGILKIAIDRHFKLYAKDKLEETILVITDGQPDSEDKVYDLLIKTTQEMKSSKQLSITFIQVGCSESARYFLKRLDNRLKEKGAKHDIVDCQGVHEINEGEMDFEKLIHESLHG
jgi:hypothetical protein